MTISLTARMDKAFAAYLAAEAAYLDDPQRCVKKVTMEFFVNGAVIELRAAPETVRKQER